MRPVEAGGAAIGECEIHINGLTGVVNVTVAVMGCLVDVATVHGGVIMMFVTARQMRMQRTERRKYETHAEQQQQDGG